MSEEEQKINQIKAGYESNGAIGEGVTALEVEMTMEEQSCYPKNRKIPIFVMSFVFTLLLSGIFMGWSSLLIPMREEGVYAWRCPYDDSSNATYISNSNNSTALGCVEQELRFNFIFSITVFMMCVFSIVNGLVLDIYGHKALATMASIMVCSGFLLVAFSSRSFEAYIPGFILFALGGGALYFANIAIGELFGKYMGTYVAILNAAFDASVVVFSIFLLVRESSPSGMSPSLREFFIAFAVLPIIYWLYSRLWPSKITASAFNPDKIEEIEDASSKAARTKAGWLDVRKAMLSWKYALFVCWASTNMLMLNHYLGSVSSMLNYQIKVYANGNPDYDYESTLEHLTKIFNWILSVAIVVSPGIGWVVDNTHPSFYILLTQLMGVVTTILRILPGNPYFQVITFIVYAVYRMFFYATACASMIYYYGMEKFGRTWGIALFFSGTFSLVQYPLNSMSELRYDGNYFVSNLIELIFTVVFLIFPIYLYRERIVSARVASDKQNDSI